ncbi:metalloregulator ArsR/SmtB family transcription factor [Leucobacter sp. gxy201]|uniref:ArsR/SmtB family transcription factor n=1 Tax=Leucobacter sp. gxy201 TaxID=2957200 RepID=UPI003DA0873B
MLDGRFKALADPTRRRIIELLVTGPRTVLDIADEFSISRPAISQHLRTLTLSGFLTVEPYGIRRLYYLNREALRAPAGWLKMQMERSELEEET